MIWWLVDYCFRVSCNNGESERASQCNRLVDEEEELEVVARVSLCILSHIIVYSSEFGAPMVFPITWFPR